MLEFILRFGPMWIIMGFIAFMVFKNEWGFSWRKNPFKTLVFTIFNIGFGPFAFIQFPFLGVYESAKYNDNNDTETQ